MGKVVILEEYDWRGVYRGKKLKVYGIASGVLGGVFDIEREDLKKSVREFCHLLDEKSAIKMVFNKKGRPMLAVFTLNDVSEVLIVGLKKLRIK